MADVDSRISISLHPENVKAIEGYANPDIAALLGPVETSFDEAYIGIQKVYEAKAHARKNQAWTEQAQILMVSDLANKVMANVTRKFDAVNANLNKTIKSLEADLTSTTKNHLNNSVSTEIRAHLKGLTTTQRMQAIREAIDEGQHEVASAVLNAPAMLLGLDKTTLEHLRNHYNATHHPNIVQRHKALSSAKEMLNQRGGLFFSELEKAVGMSSDKVKVLRDAQATAQKAFALSDN